MPIKAHRDTCHAVEEQPEATRITLLSPELSIPDIRPIGVCCLMVTLLIKRRRQWIANLRVA
jgi:hypothetical protein